MKERNILLIILIFLVACGGLEDAGKVLKNEKITNTDEFLVKKKNPLVLPPDFDKLPEPGEANVKPTKIIENNQSNIKNLLKNNDDENISNTDESTSIESSILKKIK